MHRDSDHIENQGYVAIAKDRRSGEVSKLFHMLTKWLHDDFFIVVECVNEQSVSHLSGLQH